MLPPKIKFVREIERGRRHCDAPSPPGATYLHRVLRRWRYGHDADSILPVHEKRRRPLRHAIYTRRPGARIAAARGHGDAAPARVVDEYRWGNAAARRRRRRRLTFLALMLAATVLIFGAAILAYFLISAHKK